MKCQNCSSINPDNSLFCKECGGKLLPPEEKEKKTSTIIFLIIMVITCLTLHIIFFE